MPAGKKLSHLDKKIVVLKHKAVLNQLLFETDAVYRVNPAWHQTGLKGEWERIVKYTVHEDYR